MIIARSLFGRTLKRRLEPQIHLCSFNALPSWPDGNLDRMRPLARELIDLKPDVLFADNTPSVSTRCRKACRSRRTWAF
jgi:hypothetical protein